MLSRPDHLTGNTATWIGAAIVLALGAILAAPAQAQTSRWEVSAGCAALRDTTADVKLPKGWIAGAAVRVTPWAAALAEIGDQRRTFDVTGGSVSLTLFSALAGGRVFKTIGRFTEFAQLAAGLVRAEGLAFGSTMPTTRAAVQPGIGVDVRLASHLAARAQADLRVIAADANDADRQHQTRYAVSLVYR